MPSMSPLKKYNKRVFLFRIQIKPDFQNSTTHGVETIALFPNEDTDTIIFHVNKINIQKHSTVLKLADDEKSGNLIIQNPIYSQKVKKVYYLVSYFNKTKLFFRSYTYYVSRVYGRRKIQDCFRTAAEER